ncbi:methyltransferase [uncultured Pseudacidovorax sp.]|uniref:methyltransferase n=1 Tax=uncultured Pseudacidovorax sp. TaxID=679313 RepID=UPI0025CB9FCF|nr:methyltransferase [uncultured Pseudacidovorax sp.]
MTALGRVPDRTAEGGPAHWQDAWLRLRDRLLASPAFRQWAERFAPTRWVARRRAARLFDLVSGFVYSQVLLACVRLDLFERLAQHGPQSADDLAAATALPLPAMQRLLEAACALDLIEHRSNHRYGLGALGAPMVGNAGLAAMVEHHEALYRDMVDPVALLRQTPGTRTAGGALSAMWPYARAADPSQLADAQVAAYSRLMASSVPFVAAQLLQAYRVRGHRRWLDVGGGEGALASCLALASPSLRVQVFDLPAVARRAEARFAREGLAVRCTATGGDFLRDALPTGCDVVSLVRVLHDHDDEAALRLLKAVRAALPVGGRLLIAEPMAEAPGARNVGAAYFGMYLWAMGSGHARTPAQLRALLSDSGFTGIAVRPTPMPLQSGLIVATAHDSSTSGVNQS